MRKVASASVNLLLLFIKEYLAFSQTIIGGNGSAFLDTNPKGETLITNPVTKPTVINHSGFELING